MSPITLARLVVLTHHHVDLLLPLAKEQAELAVLVYLRHGGFVLLPEQNQRNMLAAHLGIDVARVRFPAPLRGCGRRKQQRFELGVAQACIQWPADAGGICPAEIIDNGCSSDSGARGDLDVFEAAPRSLVVDDFGLE